MQHRSSSGQFRELSGSSGYFGPLSGTSGRAQSCPEGPETAQDRSRQRRAATSTGGSDDPVGVPTYDQ
eukprot:6967397-Alexandrium_andersonii.AAC.1